MQKSTATSLRVCKHLKDVQNTQQKRPILLNTQSPWNWWEWHGLAVSVEACHSKGRGFETAPSPLLFFFRERSSSKLEWRNAGRKEQAIHPREKKGGNETKKTGGDESFSKAEWLRERHKKVRATNSIKWSTPSINRMTWWEKLNKWIYDADKTCV